MWLPGPLYEALPSAYVIGGVLFLVGTLYAQPAEPMMAVYLGCGAVSILSGVLLYVRRRAARKQRSRED